MVPIERPTTAQYNTETTVTSLLNFIGGHELKIACTAIMSDHPEKQYTQTDLQEELVRSQGIPPVWEVHSGSIRDYLDGSFVMSGIARATSGPSKRHHGRTTFYQVDKAVAETASAFCGSLIEWSLDPRYHDISVTNIIGRTTSPRTPRQPELRYNLYQYLLAQRDAKTLGEIHTGLDIPDYDISRLRTQINALGKLGILSVDSRDMGYNPKLRIRRGIIDYTVPKRQNPARDVLVRALQDLYERCDRKPPIITLEGLFDACQSIDPQVDLQRVRRTVLKGNESDERYWQIIREKGYRREKKVTFAIHPGYAAPIANLCRRLAALADPDVRQYYAGLTHEMIADTQIMRSMVSKALRFSANATEARGDPPRKEKILDAIRSLGPSNTTEIITHMRSMGHPVERSGVYKSIAALLAEDVVGYELRRMTPDTKRKTRYYIIKEKRK